MIKKISTIDKDGKVLFVDAKGTGTTVGSKADCLSYGFKFRNNVCYCYDTRIKPKNDDKFSKGNIVNLANNFAIGVGNKITSGINSVALGFKNIINKQAQNAIAIGQNAYSSNYGELSYSASTTTNKSKFSIMQYNATTLNNTATEIFLGGAQGARLYINESFETTYHIDSRLVVLDSANNNAFFITHTLLYKYANSTLTEVLEVPILNQGDSALNAVSLAFAPVASTPDYIEVKVTGLASTRLDYTLILQITEITNG